MKTSKPSMDAHDKRNSLGLSNTVYKQLLGLLEKRANTSPVSAAPSGSNRVYSRVEFQEPYLEIILHGQKQASRQRIVVATRNISKGGISLLHSNFIYPGTRVTATITKLDGTSHPFGGTVRRCEHRGGVIHEIGVQFDHEICLHEFVHTDIFDRKLTLEKVDAQALQGTILIVASDNDLMSQLKVAVSSTSIYCKKMTSAKEALESELGQFQLLIIGMDADDMTGPELTRVLRDNGFVKPIILIGDAFQTIHKQQAGYSEADIFVQTPVNTIHLVRVLAEYLQDDWTPERLTNLRHAHSEESIEKMRSELHDLGQTLRSQLENKDAVKAYISLASIKNIASVLGIKSLQLATHDLCDQIADSGDIETYMAQLDGILKECA
ncbi:MAG: PilZ domain-containing protein [Phycisphaerales bacterium]